MQTTIERDHVLTAEDRTELRLAFDKVAKAFEGAAEEYGLTSPDDIPAFTKDTRQEYYEEHIARRNAYKKQKQTEAAWRELQLSATGLADELGLKSVDDVSDFLNKFRQESCQTEGVYARYAG